jgi:hypothetical protein
MTILQAVKDMNGDRAVLLSGKMSQPVEADRILKNLLKVADEFAKKVNGAPVIKNTLNVDEVWAKFEYSGHKFEEMSQREIRSICTDVSLATRREVVDTLRASPWPLTNKFNLYGFATAYFHGWRSFEEVETVELLIRSSIVTNRAKRRSRFLEVWDELPFLFSANAARRVAEIIISRHVTVHQVCTDLFIDPTSQLSVRIRQEAVEIATAQFQAKCKKLKVDEALAELRWIVEDLMSRTLEGDFYRSGISKLIDCAIADSAESFRAALVSLVRIDDRLGDPRLIRNQANWRTMTEAAREKYLAWLAVETLQFFFDAVVPKNDENRRRADFWLRYAQRPGLIKDFQVALSEEDIILLRHSKQKLPGYSRVLGGNSSAFLMVFTALETDYVIIEFSETGNAAYIYEKAEFEAGSRSLRSDEFHIKYDLKRKSRADLRILHNNEWEQKAARSLADLGILR